MDSERKMFYALACFFLLLMMGAASLDYKDQIKEQAIYCYNVENGFWPDYAKTFEKQCTKEKLEEYAKILE